MRLQDAGKGKGCKYNAHVLCEVGDCGSCGWNPTVAKARVKAFKRARASIQRKPPHEDCAACPYYTGRREAGV